MTNPTSTPYPQLEKIFQPGAAEPALRRIERTRKHLNDIAARPASPAEQQRARAAFDAFTRSLALIQEIAQVRQKLAEEAATSAASSR